MSDAAINADMSTSSLLESKALVESTNEGLREWVAGRDLAAYVMRVEILVIAIGKCGLVPVHWVCEGAEAVNAGIFSHFNVHPGSFNASRRTDMNFDGAILLRSLKYKPNRTIGYVIDWLILSAVRSYFSLIQWPTPLSVTAA